MNSFSFGSQDPSNTATLSAPLWTPIWNVPNISSSSNTTTTTTSTISTTSTSSTTSTTNALFNNSLIEKLPQQQITQQELTPTTQGTIPSTFLSTFLSTTALNSQQLVAETIPEKLIEQFWQPRSQQHRNTLSSPRDSNNLQCSKYCYYYY